MQYIYDFQEAVVLSNATGCSNKDQIRSGGASTRGWVVTEPTRWLSRPQYTYLPMEVRGREVAGLVPAMAVVRSIAWPLIGLAPVPDLRNPVSGRPELIGGQDKRRQYTKARTLRHVTQI